MTLLWLDDTKGEEEDGKKEELDQKKRETRIKTVK